MSLDWEREGDARAKRKPPPPLLLPPCDAAEEARGGFPEGGIVRARVEDWPPCDGEKGDEEMDEERDPLARALLWLTAVLMGVRPR
jgi:hypothetical protein